MSATEYDLRATIPQTIRPLLSENSVAEAWRIRLVFCLAVALIVTVPLFFSADRLLQDPDNWWQVKVGLDLLANRAVPTVDTYSYTFAGQPWIAKEWLGQVLFGASYSAFGWSGVALLTIATVTLATFILAWILSQELKPVIAVAATILITILVSAVYNARPLIFSFPIIILWTALLFRAARNRQPPPFWALALIALWANLYGTFTFGFVIAAFAGLDCLSRVRLSEPRLIAKWIAFGILCVLVTMINPYGIKAILATFTVASGNEAVPLIQEWQPFNANSNVWGEAALLLAIGGALLSGLRVRWTYAAFFLFTLHLFLAYSRFQYLWLLLVPVVFSAEIAEQFPVLSKRNWVTEPRERLENAVARHWRAISGGIVACWLAIATVFLGFSTLTPSDRTSVSGALAFARDHNLSGNVMNHYDFGGSLIFHGIKTYIDGRTDQLFLGGFMKKTVDMQASNGKPLLEEHIAKYSARWALLPVDDGRIPFFKEMTGWRQAYADKFAVIYVNGN